MAESTKIAETRIITADGVVTATVYDKIAPDHIMQMLLKGAGAAQYARVTDDTERVSRDVKDLLIFPLTETTE